MFEEINYELERNHELRGLEYWIKEELKINPKYPFKNRDFNKLTGVRLTLVFGLDLKESQQNLIKWLLEEDQLYPEEYIKMELIKRLSINVNSED